MITLVCQPDFMPASAIPQLPLVTAQPQRPHTLIHTAEHHHTERRTVSTCGALPGHACSFPYKTRTMYSRTQWSPPTCDTHTHTHRLKCGIQHSLLDPTHDPTPTLPMAGEQFRHVPHHYYITRTNHTVAQWDTGLHLLAGTIAIKATQRFTFILCRYYKACVVCSTCRHVD